MTLERALKLLKGGSVTRIGRKSSAVHAAEEQERKLGDEKKTARMRQSLNMSVVPAESKSGKVAADGKAKKTSRQNRAKLAPGKTEADNCGGVVAAVGGGESEDIQGKDTTFMKEAQSARM